MNNKISNNSNNDDLENTKSLHTTIIYVLYSLINKSSFLLKSFKLRFNILRYLLPGFIFASFILVSFYNKGSFSNDPDIKDSLKTEMSLKNEEIYKLRHRLIKTQKSLIKLSGIVKRQNKQLKESSLPSEKLPFRWLPGKNSALLYSLHISILEGCQFSKLSYTSYSPCFRLSLGISLRNTFMYNSIPLHSFSDKIKLSAEFNTGKLLLETLQEFNNNVNDSKIYTSDKFIIDFLDFPNCKLSLLSLISKKNHEHQNYRNINEDNIYETANNQSIHSANIADTNDTSVSNLMRTFSIPNWGVKNSRQYRLISFLNKNQDAQISPNSLASALAHMNLSDLDVNEQGDTNKIDDLKKSMYFILSKSILKLSINDYFAISVSI